MARRYPPPRIVVDTREQRPWSFRTAAVLRAHGELVVTTGTLATGDYSVEGLTSVVAIERKSLPDFIQSTTRERERFWAELVRMRALQRRAVIIEASLEQVSCGAYRSLATPESVIGSASAIQYDHGIPVIWAGSREDAERHAAWWLVRAWREHRAALGAEGAQVS
jgi:ERCC4-type nuclease